MEPAEGERSRSVPWSARSGDGESIPPKSADESRRSGLCSTWAVRRHSWSAGSSSESPPSPPSPLEKW